MIIEESALTIRLDGFIRNKQWDKIEEMIESPSMGIDTMTMIAQILLEALKKERK